MMGMAEAEPPAKKFKDAPAGTQSPAMGEVRFEEAASVQQALNMNGTMLGGQAITVTMDPKSKDHTKVLVTGLAPKVEWQELKDHFKQCGLVAHAVVLGRSGLPQVGTVRFQTSEEAAQAVAMLHGTMMEGSQIEVKMHPNSKDGTKVQVSSIPANAQWQELKDYFGQVGVVVHADTASAAPGLTVTGEVRYEEAAHAHQALTQLNGSTLGGVPIFVQLDMTSSDRTKLVVTGVSSTTEWGELKDHFSQIGTVAFAQVYKGPQGGKGKGGKGGAKFPMAMGMFGQMPMSQMGQMGMHGMMGGCGGCAGMMGAQNMQGSMQKNMRGMMQSMPQKGSQMQTGKGKQTGEVRFDLPMCAQAAVGMLNGSNLKGSVITVDFDWNSSDGTKIWVSGIPDGAGWQDLKDHFSACGSVAFANIKAKKVQPGIN